MPVRAIGFATLDGGASMWNRVKGFIFILFGVMNLCLFLALSFKWYMSDTIDTPPMTRSDYLDLSLSLLAVLLTAITIFLAIAAFFAYYDLRNAAERMAEKTTMSVFQRLSRDGYLDHDGERIVLQTVVATAVPKPTPDPHIIGGRKAEKREDEGDGS